MNLYTDIDTSHIQSVVMTRIARRRLLRARLAAVFHSFLILGTFLSFVPAFEYTAARGTESGFFSYLSLLTTDGTHLAGAWQAFLLSLAESAPILGSIITLAIIVVFAYATKKVFRDVESLRQSDYQSAALA